MRPPRAYHLPSSGSDAESQRLRFGDLELEMASLNAAQWRDMLATCRRATQRRRRLRQEDVLATLQGVVDEWLRPDSPDRKQAEAMVPVVTGFSAEMIRHALPKLIEPLRGDAVQRLIADEVGPLQQRGAVVPQLIAHVLSGNIPGLGAVPIHLALALGAAAVVKTASGDPLFAALWAQSIGRADPDLGDCLAVTHWRGGDRLIEDVILRDADLVVASGSDEAIAAIAARTRSRFIGYGHKISFAVVDRGALGADYAPALARRLAYDVSLWDQQGCLSPQLCYVERGGDVTPRELATLLAGELARYADELPPRRLSLAEQTAVLRFRQEAEWGRGVELLASNDSAAWTIAIEDDTRFQPTCLNRCVRIKSIADLGELVPALAHCRQYLEAAGVAAAPTRSAAVERMLRGAGVHRICAIGKMQEPPLSWRQSGRPRIGGWIGGSTFED